MTLRSALRAGALPLRSALRAGALPLRAGGPSGSEDGARRGPSGSEDRIYHVNLLKQKAKGMEYKDITKRLLVVLTRFIIKKALALWDLYTRNVYCWNFLEQN